MQFSKVVLFLCIIETALKCFMSEKNVVQRMSWYNDNKRDTVCVVKCFDVAAAKYLPTYLLIYLIIYLLTYYIEQNHF